MPDRTRIRLIAPLVQRPVRALPARNPTRPDAAALADLMLAAYRDTIDYDGETIDDALHEIRSFFAGAVGLPHLDCSWVALQGGAPVSASLVTRHDGAPLLAYAFTHPDLKGTGLATSLIQMSMNALLERGYREIHLWVTVGNQPAERVYRSLGFRNLV